jgi:hypothetical protein
MMNLRKMAAPFRYVVLCGSVASVLLSLSGCAGLGAGKTAKSKAEPDLGPTIGSVADVLKAQGVPVEGYGLVVDLPGTGSAICPPAVREYLRQYILSQISGGPTNLDDLINSPNTAVVHLEGVIPPMAMKGDRFDVRVTPIAGSDATSLRGGRMFRTELKPPGTFRIDARVLATAEGTIFTDLLGGGEPALRTGYILGGGRPLFDYVGIIHLRQPDFRMASAIRNRVNERYGPETASAVSSTDVGFDIPAEYRLRKERFVKLLGATYLVATADTAARVEAALKGLADSTDKEAREITLETLGRNSVAGLASLVKSPNEEVRLRAARCMLYLREDSAIETLYAIATDVKSPRRVEAIDTIATGARREDAGAILRRLLGDDDEQVVRAAFEHLRRLKDPVVQEELVNGDFYLDQVPSARKQTILVARSGEPRIVLLGPAMRCRDNVSVESPGGIVSVKGQTGDTLVTIVRKSPLPRTRLPSARSGLAVSDIIRTLGGDPTSTPVRRPAGLGVSYAEIVVLLEQMCQSKAVDAQFWPSPLTKFEPMVKK